jgi:hypothetical protein
VGDFNMVEIRLDKINQCGRIIPTVERIIFKTMKNHLQVSDSPRSLNSKKISWNNLRSDGSKILARFDRLYVFQEFGNMPRKLLSYRICGE